MTAREFIGVADAGGHDFDHHLALAGALDLDGGDFQRLASGDGNGCANVHERFLVAGWGMSQRASGPAQNGVAADHTIGH
jgi:hypothetical protein